MNRNPMIVKRFGWIIPIAVVVVTGVAVLVASVMGRNVSAEAVVVVSPGTTSTGPGEAIEARDLAATYAGQITRDESLLTRVAHDTGMSFASVKRSVAARQLTNTALVAVTFTAPTKKEAVVGIRAVSTFASNPPADSSLSVVSARRVTITKSPQRRRTGGYSARVMFVIPSTPASSGPGDGDQADKVATILTGLIPEDQSTLSAVARQLHMSFGAVQDA